MCGIAGLIGDSKNLEVSFQLMTSIFSKLEARGTDASGFWCCQKGKSGRIMFHKEPEKSSLFVKQTAWQDTLKFNPNLVLVHARQSSVGVGSPLVNKNNHPFTSADKCTALVHNGRIPEQEYKALKTKYEVFSQCDSEILLRIFEAGEILDDDLVDLAKSVDDNIKHRLLGIRNIWAQIIRGHMSCAIAERLENGKRRLWLWRNKHRPLWLIDLRKVLGQVFFCSTPDIWYDAIGDCPEAKAIVKGKTKLIEFPDDEIWVMHTTPQQPVVETGCLKKFGVRSEGFSTVKHTGPELKIVQGVPPTEVVMKLDKDEDVPGKYKHKATVVGGTSGQPDGFGFNNHRHFDADDIAAADEDDGSGESRQNSDTPPGALATEKTIAGIKTTLEAIKETWKVLDGVENKDVKELMETIKENWQNIESTVTSTNTMTEEEAEDLCRSLDQTKLDLEGGQNLITVSPTEEETQELVDMLEQTKLDSDGASSLIS